MKKNYAVIDIAKIVFALLIVLLHAQQKANLYPGIRTAFGAIELFLFEIVCRIAVPFFFITSSYFLFKGVESKEQSRNKVFQYCKRLLILYFVWFVVNGVYILHAKLGFPNHMTAKSFIILIRDIVLYNGFPSSWFLMASIIDAFLIWFLTRKGSNKVAIFISVVCYTICLLMTFYNFLAGDTLNRMFYHINGIWNRFYLSFPYGLIYFVLGKLIAENEDKIKSNAKNLFAVFCFMFVCLVIEVFSITYLMMDFKTISHTTYIMLPLVAVALLLLCLRCEVKYRPIYSSFRKASTIIYCSHGLVLWILGVLLSPYNIPPKYKFLILFFATAVISLFLSLFIIKGSKKYRKLKYLY